MDTSLTNLRKTAVLVFIVGSLGLGGCGASSVGEQIRNLEVLERYSSCLSQFRTVHGEYPESLAAVRSCEELSSSGAGEDWWGNQLRYEARGDSFVLISPARDGEFENLDAWSLRLDNVKENVCRNADADFVLSDRGFHRGCWK